MSRCLASNGDVIRARIRFNGHQAQLVDLYSSFSRQAAQAMNIQVSKVIFPSKTIRDISCNNDNLAKLGSSDDLDPEDAIDTRELSYSVKRWTVNRSPFVHGRHQDQFEIRTYSRDLELSHSSSEVIKRWIHYISVSMPAGVGLDYSLVDYENINN